VHDAYENLRRLGYAPFIQTDNHSPDALTAFFPSIGYPLPEDYRRFLADFPNTGYFYGTNTAARGIESAPWAPDGLYPLSMLYAACSKDSHSLVDLRKWQGEYPAHLLVIGCDFGGNSFLLDLRPQTFGHLLFHDHEESVDTLNLIARSFSDFLASLEEEPEEEKDPQTEGFWARLRRYLNY
jgi:hypothetical protein